MGGVLWATKILTIVSSSSRNHNILTYIRTFVTPEMTEALPWKGLHLEVVCRSGYGKITSLDSWSMIAVRMIRKWSKRELFLWVPCKFLGTVTLMKVWYWRSKCLASFWRLAEGTRCIVRDKNCSSEVLWLTHLGPKVRARPFSIFFACFRYLFVVGKI